MGLVALAAGLSGCGGHAKTTSGPVTAVASVTPSATGASVDGDTVTIAGLAKEQSAVTASTLSQVDKNRFAAFIDDHQDRTNAYDGKTVREVINLQTAYEVALRMTASARADDAKHKAEIAELIAPNITVVTERDRSLVLHVDLQNLSGKEIKKLDIGMEFDNAATGARVGLVEAHLTRNIPGKGRIAFDYPMGYTRFGEDAGPMIASQGTAKKLIAQVTEIKYADGTDAGFDD